MKNNHIVNIDKQIKSAMLLASICGSLLLPSVADAFPVYAQQAYENPREATGRIVCANCHLGAKPTEIEVPQGVLPDTVFEAVVEIPYDKSLKQVTADGSKGPLNVGAVVVLPEGFKLAPKERLSDELKKATEGVVISPYSDSKQSILVVGPIPGDNHQKIVFPILSPNPAENRDVHFIKYPIYVGGNRKRTSSTYW
jgi:apocytochrome f